VKFSENGRIWIKNGKKLLGTAREMIAGNDRKWQ